MSSKDLADLDFFFSGGNAQQQPPAAHSATQGQGFVSAPMYQNSTRLDDVGSNPWASFETSSNLTPANTTNVSQTAIAGGDEGDDFGDFETGTGSASEAFGSLKISDENPWGDSTSFSPPTALKSPPTGLKSTGQTLQASTIAPSSSTSPRQTIEPYKAAAIENESRDRDQIPSRLTTNLEKKEKQRADDNVLFDADEVYEEDEFGEFEEPDTPGGPEPVRDFAVKLAPIEQRAEVKNPPLKKMPGPSLLDFDDDDSIDQGSLPWQATMQPAAFSSEATTSSSSRHRRSISTASLHKPLPEPPRDDDFGAWDDFEEAQAPSKPVAVTSSLAEKTGKTEKTLSPASPLNDADAWDDFESFTPIPAAAPLEEAPPAIRLPILLPTTTIPSQPPSNIPPPVVLLSMFPAIINRVRSTLLDPIAALPHDTSSQATRTAILQHTTTHQFLTSFLSTATALAHVLAGRKQRWKRDTRLAQSMRIGPASGGGGGGGMKLTGLDRSENAKEEREAEDVVALWQTVVGRVRTTIAAAGLRMSSTTATAAHVPEIADAMPIRLAGPSEGGVIEAKACIVCGLKRNERVAKVDVAVEDSFGEWWVPHWGHRSCAEVWVCYNESLKGR